MGGVLLWGGNKEVFRDEAGVGGSETRPGGVVKASCQLRRSNATPDPCCLASSPSRAAPMRRLPA